MRSIHFATLCGLGILFGCSDAATTQSPEEADSDPATVIAKTYDTAGVLPATVSSDDALFAGNVGVVAPEPGEAVGIEVHGVDGNSWRLSVERRLDGTVNVINLPDAPMQTESYPNKCADGAFALEGDKWTTPYSWWFRAASTPKGMTVSAAEGALVRAANNITGAHNACGIADPVSATHVYKGHTSAVANITATATTVACTKRDGVNVVSFGALPQHYLGLTCYWYDPNTKRAIEADVKLNSYWHPWFADSSVPKGCSGRFGVEATTTHEMGHVFGLAHVSMKLHGELTMAPAMGPCTLGPARLGKGDILGLASQY